MGEGTGQQGPAASITLPSFFTIIFFFSPRNHYFLLPQPWNTKTPALTSLLFPTRLHTDPIKLMLSAELLCQHFDFTFFFPSASPASSPHPLSKSSHKIQQKHSLDTRGEKNKIKQPKSSYPWSSIPILRVNIPLPIFHAQDETREVPCCTIAKRFPLTPLSSFGWQLILPDSAKSALARTRDTGDVLGHTAGPARGEGSFPAEMTSIRIKETFLFLYIYICVCVHVFIHKYILNIHTHIYEVYVCIYVNK